MSVFGNKRKSLRSVFYFFRFEFKKGMSQQPNTSKFVSEEIIGLGREGGKKFKKQRITTASEEEKNLFSLIPLRNECVTSTEIVWFDPVIDPRKCILKQPVKRLEGGVSFLLFAALPDNKPIELLPTKFTVIGSGFCVHSGLYEHRSVFGDYPNWYASIVGLSYHVNDGIFVSSVLIDPHDHQELKVSLFNMGCSSLVIKPNDPIGEIVFNGCHVPDIASVSNLIERFQGEKECF